MGIINPCCVLKYLLVAIATFPSFINAQMDCSAAPTSALRIVCEQLHRWDKNAREAPAVTTSIPLPPAIPGLPAPLLAAELAPVASTPYQCMDIGCLCNYLGGNGQTGTNTCSLATVRKSVRKEYRMLSDDERARFHAALKAIKASGEYDRIATIHSQFATAGSAHSGPGFLPWHREFVKRFEIALKQVDPRVSLPYWDSTLDGILPAPKDSVMFSNDGVPTKKHYFKT
uniref:Tyrosinase copper-binding domain-containing protein n=1 Tax=Meloidogyne incognita TaxID=6306 RepID=A0A914MUL4_MELIC